MNFVERLKLWWQQRDYMLVPVPDRGVTVVVVTPRNRSGRVVVGAQHLWRIESLQQTWPDIVSEVNRRLRRD